MGLSHFGAFLAAIGGSIMLGFHLHFDEHPLHDLFLPVSALAFCVFLVYVVSFAVIFNNKLAILRKQ